MILYNTLMGVAAGTAEIMVALLARKLHRRESIAPEGWALTFGILGVILTFLSGLMTVTWPLNVNPPMNILFGEPAFVLGLLLLAAAFFMWTRAEAFLDLDDTAFERLIGVVTPVSWLVFVLGLILLSCTLAVFRFGFVGAAPAEEPISGLLHDYPAAENTFIGLLYAVSAVGPLLAPFALRNLGGRIAQAAVFCMAVSGTVFLLFSVMNYYTHIGLLVNLLQKTSFKM
jgi:uncharacterized membrane protein